VAAPAADFTSNQQAETRAMRAATFLKSGSSLGWLIHLGAASLVLVGIIDQSFVPIPGGIDVLLVLLAASRKAPGVVYWACAMFGAVFGAWLTYKLSKKAGKEALKKRLARKRIKKVEATFKKGGFWALFIGGLLPPPLPLVPIVVGAGALQYPTRRFLIAISASRAIRYTLIVYLAHRYGTGIMRVFTAHKVAIIVGFLVFSVGASVIGWLWTRYEKRKEAHERRPKRKRPKAA
jgi:membrane protein DedA with SNARE-associated domain